MNSREDKISMIFRIYGVVQGVGFRPFVNRIACKYHITGTVINKGSWVEIAAQGTGAALDKFRAALTAEAPERSDILNIECEKNDDLPEFEDFTIEKSLADSGEIFIPPDIAICPDCRRELLDKNDRRDLHSVINCTACGPRLTILEALPYDRERTSMKKFPMCPECEKEYFNIASRRYDAQPVCCNECGPELYVVGSDLRGGAAISYVRREIMQGKIVAIKGIGGFHLACDGHNIAAVERLRQLKHRPVKPFAVMMRDLAAVQKFCQVTHEAEKWLDGSEKPILLLNKKDKSPWLDAVAPGNPTLGVMLPYAPLHILLFDYPDEVIMTDCLVMTSGNCSGAPICRDDESAATEIGSFCDCILSHDRDIRLRADDSVMTIWQDKPYMIRRSRGFAPLPVRLNMGHIDPADGSVLAIGGELKNAFCMTKGNLAYPAPHIGDMEDMRSVAALKESIGLFSSMLECQIKLAVCDLHPAYHTTEVAESMNLPLLKIQHHYAHILSCMAENNCFSPVIGVALDGTGYGSDGTIWGGEVLTVSTETFERFAHIAAFPQAGGDASSREGWRITIGMLERFLPQRAEEYAGKFSLCSPMEYKVISTMINKKINTVESTSAGRLFDAVSALLGIARESTFEGEAAMKLEFAAEAFARENPDCGLQDSLIDEFEVDEEVLPTDKLFVRLAEMHLQGNPVGRLAYIFHRELANMIIRSCEKAREKSSVNICALSGGTFQNKLLLTLCYEGLQNRDFKVLTHSLVPANDGGIALGQALAGMVELKKYRSVPNTGRL